MNKDYLEKCLPTYLEKDLQNLKEGIKNKVNYLDCLIDELQGSINKLQFFPECKPMPFNVKDLIIFRANKIFHLFF